MTGGVVTAGLADNAVTGSKIADGSLDARDIARFSGRFRIPKSEIKDAGDPETIDPASACPAGRSACSRSSSARTSARTSCSSRRTRCGRTAR